MLVSWFTGYALALPGAAAVTLGRQNARLRSASFADPKRSCTDDPCGGRRMRFAVRIRPALSGSTSSGNAVLTTPSMVEGPSSAANAALLD
jgi:hypothetical protein